MLKTFKHVFKENKRNFYLINSCGFSLKNIKPIDKSLKFDKIKHPELVEITEEGENKLENIKLLQGRFPYLPLDDHPLIPGYARMLSLSKEIFDKLKELEVENTQLVISVLKNPEQMDAVQLGIQNFQMNLNFVPNIKSKDDVYDFGCLCEVKLREEKNFGVKKEKKRKKEIFLFFLFFFFSFNKKHSINLKKNYFKKF